MDNHGETITIAEPMVVAQRGREPNVLTQTRTEEGKRLRKDYEAHKITKQRKYMQQYEARTDGVTNTLTSVQKDNMVVEPLRIKVNSKQGFADVGEYGAVNIARPSSDNRRGRVQGEKGDIVGALLTGQEKAVVEPLASVHPMSHALEFKSTQLSDVSPCLRATESKAVTCAWEKNETEPPFRIRRLIPRECFRLMDVTDEDYDKINTYIRGYRKNGVPIKISESQQYKLAGNSIVVACMYYIFESLFFPADNEITEPKQLDIFNIIE